MRSDPEINARRIAAIAETRATPEYREKMARIARKRMATTDWAERNRQWMLARRIWETSTCHSPEANAKRGASVSATRMAWCPVEYRDEARRMVRNERKRLAEVKRIIAAKVELDKLKPLLGYVIEAAQFVATHDRCPVMQQRDGTWRYSNGVRTAEQIVAMAVRKGWQRWDVAA